jgi:hypothetical protein
MRSPAKLLAIIAAGGALAIGVPAALAATGSSDTQSPATTTQPVQQQEQAAPQDAPDGHDCPEKGGRGDGDGGNAAPDAGAQGTTTPAPTTTPDV